MQVVVPGVAYYHIELENHGVLLAEGLPAESYLDTGNRSSFVNGGPVVQMPADLSVWTWQAQDARR